MFSSIWLFMSLGFVLSKCAQIDNQLITDAVDFYSVKQLTIMYDTGAEHNFDYSLCQNGVAVCLGYSEENLEAISTSLEVAM